MQKHWRFFQCSASWKLAPHRNADATDSPPDEPPTLWQAVDFVLFVSRMPRLFFPGFRSTHGVYRPAADEINSRVAIVAKEIGTL